MIYYINYIYILIIYNLSDWRDLNPHNSTPNVDTLPITQQSDIYTVNRDYILILKSYKYYFY